MKIKYDSEDTVVSFSLPFGLGRALYRLGFQGPVIVIRVEALISILLLITGLAAWWVVTHRKPEPPPPTQIIALNGSS